MTFACRVTSPSAKFSIMAPNPLAVLKKGLSILKDTVKKRREGLVARLKKKETISDADTAWLDNDANQVDEDALIDKLDKASDYERGLSRLNSQERGIVAQLTELARETGETVGKASGKRKSVC